MDHHSEILHPNNCSFKELFSGFSFTEHLQCRYLIGHTLSMSTANGFATLLCPVGKAPHKRAKRLGHIGLQLRTEGALVCGLGGTPDHNPSGAEEARDGMGQPQILL